MRLVWIFTLLTVLGGDYYLGYRNGLGHGLNLAQKFSTLQERTVADYEESIANYQQEVRALQEINDENKDIQQKCLALAQKIKRH